MKRYDPPGRKDESARRAYDEQWERERATEDHAAGQYRPPPWAKEGERRAYDEQWEIEKAKSDYRK